MAHTKVYSDLDYELGKDTSGNVKIVYDEDSISQSIETILSTRKGERIMLPAFGGSLEDYLFEPMTEHVVRQMEKAIEDSIANWEDRVRVNKVFVNPDYDRNKYEISIGYTILTTGRSSSFHAFVDQII